MQGPSKTRNSWWFKPQKKRQSNHAVCQLPGVFLVGKNHELWSISCISSSVSIFSSLTWWTQWHLEVAGTVGWHATVGGSLESLEILAAYACHPALSIDEFSKFKKNTSKHEKIYKDLYIQHLPKRFIPANWHTPWKVHFEDKFSFSLFGGVCGMWSFPRGKQSNLDHDWAPWKQHPKSSRLVAL